MSIENRYIGGISGDFSAPVELKSGPGKYTKVTGFPSWAIDCMSAYYLCQIQTAFHLQSGTSRVGDK